MMLRVLVVLMAAVLLAAAQEPSTAEQESLSDALTDGDTSAVDMIRALEGHLARYPQSEQRGEIEQRLARAALEAEDWDRLVKYGEPILKLVPDDQVLLDRVSFALLQKNEPVAAERAYKYAHDLERILEKIRVRPSYNAAYEQDEYDRAYARTLLFQAKARSITGHYDDAARMASRAFAAYPSEAAAREWAEALNKNRKFNDAIARLADAFTLPDPASNETIRASNRKMLGEWYKARHGSEKGLGDVILASYDRMAAVVENRKKKLLALDPNGNAKTPMEFTLADLNGKPFKLSSLKGNIVVLDFWATWCLPCRIQHPLYEELQKRFPKGSGVVFLGINSDEERIAVEPFLDEFMWGKDNIYFEDGLVRLLSVTNIPATVVFDRSGKLASRMDGFDPNTFVEQMTNRLNLLLSQPATVASNN